MYFRTKFKVELNPFDHLLTSTFYACKKYGPFIILLFGKSIVTFVNTVLITKFFALLRWVI